MPKDLLLALEKAGQCSDLVGISLADMVMDGARWLLDKQVPLPLPSNWLEDPQLHSALGGRGFRPPRGS